MRMRTRRTLAILLSAVLLLCITPAAFADSLDLGAGKNTVKVGLVSQDDFAEDIVKAKLQADFYLVADAKPVEGIETYNLEMKTPYATEIVRTTADGNVTAAQELAALVKEAEPKFDDLADVLFKVVREQKLTPSAFGKQASETAEEIAVNGLNPGMYLIVMRGSDLTATDDTATGYLKKVTVPGTKDGEKDQDFIRSRALTQDYEYIFKPMLVTVPGKLGADEKPVSNTADEGTWTNVVEVNVKAEREAREGDLKIVKNLTGYVGPDPATFVFKIVAKVGKDIVYRDVVSISYPTDKPYVEIKGKIPVGAVVTVTEVYTGSRYQQTGSVTYTVEQTGKASAAADKQEIVTRPAVLTATFSNKHDNTDTGGYGIINQYTYSGGWEKPPEQIYPDSKSNG